MISRKGTCSRFGKVVDIRQGAVIPEKQVAWRNELLRPPVYYTPSTEPLAAKFVMAFVRISQTGGWGSDDTDLPGTGAAGPGLRERWGTGRRRRVGIDCPGGGGGGGSWVLYSGSMTEGGP